ncbi:MAG TPA: 50S ribosomal protein L5 [Candidatus Omnitrophica bacterium]|nr:MAG: 50S ribosomal protein L5 [Omnitrophica WOR_2 bacterium GWA2_45_18]OGX19720.1 MAG: 50S ribosomal protein L5 [Omnitrophica WOR_2 bacterium GWC2_45_7]HBR14648.1 50S ribosomal protein L5 [Candidatus Omnitrophota bacterium]
MIPRLQKKYKEECIVKMQEKFGIKNYLAVPKLEKIIVSMGVGKAISDMKILDSAVQDLSIITGQKPLVTRSKKAISNFKLRENLSIGCKVTLRRSRMYEFLDRLVNVTLPRIRDFNGVSRKSFDAQGNYNMGIEEQSIFPEIDVAKVSHTQGMNITFVFNQGTKEQTHELLSLLGMPFSKK